MIRNTTKRQKLGWVLFILYLCLLAYFMFFSESFGRTDGDRDYAYNLVPFREITRYFKYYRVMGITLFLLNIVGNVAAFMPFGFFLPIISRRSKKWYNTVMFGFVFSLILESLQLVSRVGSFDVDDMLLNTIGAALGFISYQAVQRTRIRMRKKWRGGR
ncbi:MAG: VanZ family protein [Enterocloster sp.]